MFNIGQIPAKWARLTPDRPAIIDIPNGRRSSFLEFDEEIRRLANGLLSRGLAQGDRVAILSQNSTEFIAAYFACARAGLVAQPLNWRLSGPELARVLKDADPKALLMQDHFSELTHDLREHVDVPLALEFGPDSDGSYLDLIGSSTDDEPGPSRFVRPDDPAFILYTGGTTGESKGALHSHSSAFHGMINQTVGERIQSTDVYLLLGQMFHIPVVLSMAYMAQGCPNVLMNFEPSDALAVIEEERVSGFLGVTTMLNWMMAVPNFSSFDLSSLRNVVYGGGPMPSRVISEALDAFPCELMQGYGQTEGVTMTFLTAEDHRRAIEQSYRPERLRSCGREAFATEIRVVDPDGLPVSNDGSTPGEIIVRSRANMLGYYGKPDLTAKTIRDGWMWTGDVATWDDEGYIFIVDRAKDMIISGGENIYSAQVEEAIGRHPSVLETAVIGVPDDEWGESVKAFVVLRPDTEATEQEIIDTARKHLASYQKPRSVEFLSELPKAPTGKILKRTLRAPFWEGRERGV